MDSNYLPTKLFTKLKDSDCLIKKNQSKAQNIIESELSAIKFQYNYDADFKFINTTVSEYTDMFFEEQLTKRAMSYFRNNRLGGEITDADFENCLQLVTTNTFKLLSTNYKRRLSMYLCNEENNEEDDAIISFIYLHARKLLFPKCIEYNQTITGKARIGKSAKVANEANKKEVEQNSSNKEDSNA